MTIYQEHIFILIGFRTVCLLFLCQEHGSVKGQENQDELVVEASRELVCPNPTHQAWCPVEMKSHFEAWRHPDEVELAHRWAAKLATVAAAVSSRVRCSAAPQEAGALSTRTLGPSAPLLFQVRMTS